MPTFYVYSVERSGNVLSIVCYDGTQRADIPFDSTTFKIYQNKSGNVIPASQVANGACSSCKAGGASYDSKLMPKIDFVAYEDIYDKSCRNILEQLAISNAGIWQCRSMGTMTLCPTTGGSNVYNIDRDKVLSYTGKGSKTVSRVFLNDSKNSIDYDIGSGERKSSISVSGSLISDKSGEIGSAYFGTYHAFDMNVIIDHALHVGDNIVIDNIGQLTIWGVTINFGAVNITAQLSHAEQSMTESEYITADKRAIEQRIEADRIYKNALISKSYGIQTVYINHNTGEKQTYGYEVKDKGVTVYEGNEISKNTAEEITVSDDVSEVKYSIGGIMKAVLSLVWDGDVLKSYCRKILDMDGKVIHDDKEAADNE